MALSMQVRLRLKLTLVVLKRLSARWRIRRITWTNVHLSLPSDQLSRTRAAASTNGQAPQDERDFRDLYGLRLAPVAQSDHNRPRVSQVTKPGARDRAPGRCGRGPEKDSK